MKKQIRLICIVTALFVSLQSVSVFAKKPEKVKNDTPEAKQTQEKEDWKKNIEDEEVADDGQDEESDDTDKDLNEDIDNDDDLNEDADDADDDLDDDDDTEEDSDDDDNTEEDSDDDDKKDRKKEKHNKKFTKEELETRKKEYREKRLESKEYFAEIKINFGKADAETKKLILAEIAELKEALKDYSIGVFVKGIEIDFEKYNNVKPRIENNRTLVPIRAVTESLGAKVEWDEETQTITISKGENIVVLQIGSTTVTVNGTEQECEVAPEIENGRTLVPLRIISESLDENVEWDENSKTVIIEEN